MIELPIKTVAGLNARENWRARHRRVKAERLIACHGVRQLGLRAIPYPAVVTMTRLSPGTLDSDNLQGALKAVRDGIADAFGMADNDPRIEWRYAQEKCKRGEFAVRIEVEGL
jgi:hypothetical protein